MRKRDLSDKALAQSADRCNGCKWRDNPLNKVVCEQCPKHKLGSGSEVVDALVGLLEQAGGKVVDVTPIARANPVMSKSVVKRLAEQMGHGAIEFTVDGIPVGKGRPRFTRTGHCYTPAKTVAYENLVKLAYTAAVFGTQTIRLANKYTGPVLLSIRAYFPIPKSWKKVERVNAMLDTVRYIGKPDWDNIGKIVSDALNGLAWKDDSQVDGMVTRYYSPKPRLEVRIERVEA